jgi:hypothetical protein
LLAGSNTISVEAKPGGSVQARVECRSRSAISGNSFAKSSTASEMKREADDYFPLAIFVTVLGNRPIEVAQDVTIVFRLVDASDDAH